MFRSNFIEKFKKRILFSITGFRKSLLFEVMWTNFVEPDKAQMAHAVGMLDTEGYKHTLGICNT